MRGCAVSRRFIDVCNCDMFSVVTVYLDHLRFCVVCINGRLSCHIIIPGFMDIPHRSDCTVGQITEKMAGGPQAGRSNSKGHGSG